MTRRTDRLIFVFCVVVACVGCVVAPVTRPPHLRDALPPMSEDELSAVIKGAMEAYGCTVYSVERQRQQQTAGVPDLIVFHHRRARFAFVELKTSRGRLSNAQREFRDLCRRTGTPWRLWRCVQDGIDWLEHREPPGGKYDE